eukprot:scaffold185581_cov30-Tisochrysis_lutea.AAC.2
MNVLRRLVGDGPALCRVSFSPPRDIEVRRLRPERKKLIRFEGGWVAPARTSSSCAFACKLRRPSPGIDTRRRPRCTAGAESALASAACPGAWAQLSRRLGEGPAASGSCSADKGWSAFSSELLLWNRTGSSVFFLPLAR